ncbi:hypothetical protein [Mycolicibacterium canariasense]|uniref:hypothetical protein n=1 Tax=Mycolicibacterium canariasense TaxID=228230 RepID=UPI0007890B81|nr:hypothetical protein [Mycolicibacterium canariasense]MCV7210204.1 hypothetical protein [Mycolicibacterium canariasense]ORU98473.1 hypothetical protein AWB94_28435 [Mycolicibacterium canariasense]
MSTTDGAHEPVVLDSRDGRIQVHPGGLDGLAIMVTPADWRRLNAKVEAVIAASPNLASYLACEGADAEAVSL